MPKSEYTRVHYREKFPVTHYVIIWAIKGPLKLLDGLLTTASLGAITPNMSSRTLERFRIHKLNVELQLEEKING